MHLAQVNVARMRYAPSDPRMSDLVGQIADINRLGDLSPGFVWRLPGELITGESLTPLTWLFQPFEPDLIFYNMSVWESVEGLKEFVYRTAHLSVLKDKARWIDPDFSGPHLALWWVPPGHRPTIVESSERLRSLRDHGPTAASFSFGAISPRLPRQ